MNIHDFEDTPASDAWFTIEPSDDSELNPDAMEAAHEAAHPPIIISKIGENALVGANTQSKSDVYMTIRSAIETARYRSGLKDVAKNLALSLARKQITNEEYELLFNQFLAKRSSFEISSSMRVKPERLSTESLDWAQRQLPVGDR